MTDYNNVVERINLLHEVCAVEVKRGGYFSPAERFELKDYLLSLDDKGLESYKVEFEKTKTMTLPEIAYYRESKILEIKNVFLTDKKTSIMDFDLDETSMAILNGDKIIKNHLYNEGKPKNINNYKFDNTKSSINYKI